jgi:hypothetical protein
MRGHDNTEWSCGRCDSEPLLGQRWVDVENPGGACIF